MPLLTVRVEISFSGSIQCAQPALSAGWASALWIARCCDFTAEVSWSHLQPAHQRGCQYWALLWQQGDTQGFVRSDDGSFLPAGPWNCLWHRQPLDISGGQQSERFLKWDGISLFAGDRLPAILR